MPAHAYLKIKFQKVPYYTYDEETWQQFFKKFTAPGTYGGTYDDSGAICHGTPPYYYNSIHGGSIEAFGDKDEIYDKLISCGVKPWEIKEIILTYI